MAIRILKILLVTVVFAAIVALSQNTACPQSGCLNNGEDTNVYANLASATCFSSGPDTTTICQKDRSFVFPNH